MARNRTRLTLAIVLTMFLAGCTSAPTPDWGKDDGELHVEIDGDQAVISSKMGPKDYSETHNLLGCDGEELKFTGLLLSSTIYSEHPDLEGIESAAAAAVIMDNITWTEAMGVEEGKAGRLNLKDWSSPVNPQETVGNKLVDNEGKWLVFGIIPASENIADGLNVLEIWHQPITLTGYIVEKDGTGDKCAFSQSNGIGDMMVVTNIKTEAGIVSLDGESDDEYSLGDTDLFGGWTFILFFLVVGLGGGAGLFIVSTMVIRQGAKSTAETLLGREGFARAMQMKQDLKLSKKEGHESAAAKAAKKADSSKPKVEKRKEEKVESLAGFSLDNVLSSSDDGGPTEFGGGGSGAVTVTNEAASMASQPAPAPVSAPAVSNAPAGATTSPMASTSVTSTQPAPSSKRAHFSAAMSGSSLANQPTKASKPTKAAKPVKRRAVKKKAAAPAPEPEPEPEPQAPERRGGPSVADDDFSDFSL